MRWVEWNHDQTATEEAYGEAGRAARALVPRKAHGHYEAPLDRDPLGIIEEQNSSRIQELVPLRMQRMSQSVYTFYRGTAAIQANDLAAGPDTDHLVVAGGDAHLNNFGLFAAPDRSMVFDMNDFDEAAPAPWEWDVKRLATSAVLAARENGLSETAVRQAGELAASSYRKSVRAFAQQSPLERYYLRLEVGDQPQMKGSSAKALARTLRRSERRTSEEVADRLLDRSAAGDWRFRDDPPVLTRVQGVDGEKLGEVFEQYLHSTNPDIHLLLLQYRPRDIARRVVGVGSVGTECYIAVFSGPKGEPLILQLKAAGRSVLNTYGRISGRFVLPEHVALRAITAGQRVVSCQRMMQASSDPFLGFVTFQGRGFYVRQFRDRNTGIDLSRLDSFALFDYIRICGHALARAHVQSPGAAFIAAYLGGSDSFDRAIGDWGLAYASQAADDFAAFTAAIESGRFQLEGGLGG